MEQENRITLIMPPDVEQFIRSAHIYKTGGIEIVYGKFSFTRTDDMTPGHYHISTLWEEREAQRLRMKVHMPPTNTTDDEERKTTTEK